MFKPRYNARESNICMILIFSVLATPSTMAALRVATISNSRPFTTPIHAASAALWASHRRASNSDPQFHHRPRLLKTDGSLEIVCLHLPSPVTGNSAKKRSRYSARIEAGRNGAPTPVRFADERLVSRKPVGEGFQSGIGHQWRTRSAKCRSVGCQRSVKAWSRGSDCVHLTEEQYGKLTRPGGTRT